MTKTGICQIYENISAGWKIPEYVVIRYDSDAKPVYRNIYLNMLRNDEITMEGLRSLATFGFTAALPDEIVAFFTAHISGAIADDASPFGYYRHNSNPEYAQKRMRLKELRRLLRDATIEPIDGGWMGMRIIGEQDGQSEIVMAARVTRETRIVPRELSTDVQGAPVAKPDNVYRNHGCITTEIAELPAERWTNMQLEVIGHSNDYQQIMLWLYKSKFIP